MGLNRVRLLIYNTNPVPGIVEQEGRLCPPFWQFPGLPQRPVPWKLQVLSVEGNWGTWPVNPVSPETELTFLWVKIEQKRIKKFTYRVCILAIPAMIFKPPFNPGFWLRSKDWRKFNWPKERGTEPDKPAPAKFLYIKKGKYG